MIKRFLIILQGNLDISKGFNPDVLSYNDYYPFGMTLPGRTSTGNDYRYGFNGKEKDDELKGEGNHFDYGLRNYDPRVGRFFSVDPLASVYPYLTPYQFASNRPIDGNDLDGKEWVAKSSEKVNSDGSITITTSLVIKMKVINESEKITSPDKIKAKAELIKTSIENRGKRTINFTEGGKSYTHIVTTEVILDYTPKHPDDPGQIGFLIFDDRKSTTTTETINNPDGTTTINTKVSSVPGINRGIVNFFETRIGITMDDVEVPDEMLTETGDHEIFGHSGGLNHPWELGDIEKLFNPKLIQGSYETSDCDIIYNNAMNTDENPDETLRPNSTSTRQDFLDGQIRAIIKNVKDNAVWSYDEIKPKQ